MSEELEVPNGDVFVSWQAMRLDVFFLGILIPVTILSIVLMASDAVLFLGFLLLLACTIVSGVWFVRKVVRVAKIPPRIKSMPRKQLKSREALLGGNWEDVFRDIERNFREPPSN